MFDGITRAIGGAERAVEDALDRSLGGAVGTVGGSVSSATGTLSAIEENVAGEITFAVGEVGDLSVTYGPVALLLLGLVYAVVMACAIVSEVAFCLAGKSAIGTPDDDADADAEAGSPSTAPPAAAREPAPSEEVRLLDGAKRPSVRPGALRQSYSAML